MKNSEKATAPTISTKIGDDSDGTSHAHIDSSSNRTISSRAQGGVTEGECGEHYYVAISAEGIGIGIGYWRMASDQLERYREAVAADGEIMAVSHVHRPIWGVQFHPESIGSQYGKVMLGNFLKRAEMGR